MLSSAIPAKFNIPFASSAGPGFITTPIPEASQIGSNPGRASLTDGFPPLNFTPEAAGGLPPFGADMNGLMQMVTSWLQWAAAGGIPVAFDATFALKIGGYPKGAFLQKVATMDRYWISTADNNMNNPDTGGANWLPFPDVIVQQQAGNYAIDVGAVNAFEVTLSPEPASLASIVGSPIRVRAANGNTVINPTILIHNVAGDLALPMINSNGNPLLVNQISRAHQIFEGFVDGLGFFQVTSPAPIAGGSSSALPPGMVVAWPNDIPPAWALECAGQTLLISAYPTLWGIIGTKYGGDGINNFKLPDYRGEFLRGWDHGRGLDANSTARTNRGDGTTGDHTGTNEIASVRGGDLGSGSSAEITIVPDGHLLPNGGHSTSVIQCTPNGLPQQDGSALSDRFFGNGVILSGQSGFSNTNFSPVDATIQGLFSFPNSGQETRPVNINVMWVMVF